LIWSTPAPLKVQLPPSWKPQYLQWVVVAMQMKM
jgi:hypothetical protein